MRRLRFVLLAMSLAGSLSYAETGAEGWLRYAPIADAKIKAEYEKLPTGVVSLDDSAQARSAQAEMVRGFQSMLGRTLHVGTAVPANSAFVLGTVTEIQQRFPGWKSAEPLKPEGYAITTLRDHGHIDWLIAGADSRGILYGTFRLLEDIGEQHDLKSLAAAESPSAPVRWVDQWDNLNGTIERGYAGRSIFFDNGHVRDDLTRAGE